MEDVLTGDQPARVALEEEEELLRDVAQHYGDAPRVQLDDGASCSGCTLLLASGRGAVALLRHAADSLQACGTVTLPPLPVAEDAPALPSNHERTAPLLRGPVPAAADAGNAISNGSTDGGTTGSGAAGGVVVALVPDEIPAERARAWVGALVAALQPSAAMALTALPAHEFCGGVPADMLDETLVFAVESGSVAGAAKRAGVRYLPSGTLVGGVPAALLAHCQMRGLPGVLLAGVQAAPLPDGEFVRRMAAAGTALAGAAGLKLGGVRLDASAALRGACAELDAAYVSSASASLYA